MDKPNLDVGRLGLRPLENPVLTACREWYAGVVAEPPATAAQVKAAWDARFHPIAWPTTRGPTRREREMSPGTFFFSPRRDRLGRFTGEGWWAIAPREAPAVWDFDPPATRDSGEHVPPSPGSFAIQSYAGGLYVLMPDGRIVIDADEAAGMLTSEDPTDVELARFIRGLMAASRGQSPADPARRSRKRRDVRTTARALALALLVPRLGTRAAARELLRWDQQLEAPGRNAPGGDLASKSVDKVLVDTEPDELDTDESTLMRSAYRMWRALGVAVLPSHRAGRKS